jgi:hypothetical protein
MPDSITPPPELLQLWFEQHYAYNKGLNELLIEVARYGADQELEACCEWLQEWQEDKHPGGIENLRAARRPNPQEPTDEELLALMPQQMRDDLAAASRALAQQAATAAGVFRVVLNTDALEFARAVLAHWGKS